MTRRLEPLPPQDEEVVFGVSMVLLTGAAQFSAGGDEARKVRVELGGGRRGGVPVVEAWRRALRRDLSALGLRTTSAIFDQGCRAGVYLAELDQPAARKAAEQAMIEHGPGGAAARALAARLPLFDRYREGLPPFVQRRHEAALDAAREKALRGVDAQFDLFGR